MKLHYAGVAVVSVFLLLALFEYITLEPALDVEPTIDAMYTDPENPVAGENVTFCGSFSDDVMIRNFSLDIGNDIYSFNSSDYPVTSDTVCYTVPGLPAGTHAWSLTVGDTGDYEVVESARVVVQ